MLNTVRAVVKQGRVELLEQVSVPDGTELLVTILSNDESQFWLGCSESALDRVWNNTDDDVYAELLKK